MAHGSAEGSLARAPTVLAGAGRVPPTRKHRIEQPNACPRVECFLQNGSPSSSVGVTTASGIMAAMRRRLFPFAAGMSALLCVAVCVLWVRSHWLIDTLCYETSPTDWTQRLCVVGSAGGHLFISVNDCERHGFLSFREWELAEMHGWHNKFGEVTDESYADWSLKPGRDPDQRLVVFGFQGEWTDKDSFGAVHRAAAIPFYALFLLSAVLPIMWIRRRRRAAVVKAAGLCPSCGYDLRATPDRCPECGATRGGVSGA